MSDTATCPFCEAEISTTASKCRHCGEWISRNCLSCGTPIKNQWAARGYCAECQKSDPVGALVQAGFDRPQVPLAQIPRKSRTISVGLSLVLGGFGAHKFYLDKPGVGLAYLMFFWTGIPSILGIVDGVRYIRMDEEEFQRRYGIKSL